MRKIKRSIARFIINNFLSTTHFFRIKRQLLIWASVEVGTGTKIVGPIYFGNVIDIKIGHNCWIGKNISIDGNGSILIGDNVDVAPHVVISTGGHKIESEIRRAGQGIVNTISIEDGCWIGTNTTIINNTTIGSGCVIAAGSTVIRDSAPNQLLAGVPAVRKKTF